MHYPSRLLLRILIGIVSFTTAMVLETVQFLPILTPRTLFVGCLTTVLLHDPSRGRVVTATDFGF